MLEEIPDSWIPLGKGRHRRAYLTPNGYVVKVPRWIDGEEANILEAKAWKNRHDESYLKKTLNLINGAKLARCRLIPSTYILVMEFVWPNGDGEIGGALSQRFQDAEEHWPAWARNRFQHVDSEDLPIWAQWLDCQQVGFNRKGELVAYDYAT